MFFCTVVISFGGANQYNDFPVRNESYFYICKYLLLLSSSNVATMNMHTQNSSNDMT